MPRTRTCQEKKTGTGSPVSRLSPDWSGGRGKGQGGGVARSLCLAPLPAETAPARVRPRAPRMGPPGVCSLALTVLLLAVLCPLARGTCNDAPCGVCKSNVLLGFQPVPLARLSRLPERRQQQGVLGLTSGLRDWLGIGRNGRRQEKWKQAVTEVRCTDQGPDGLSVCLPPGSSRMHVCTPQRHCLTRF